jgi:thiol-disulfide isomerase/thioredoxin
LAASRSPAGSAAPKPFRAWTPDGAEWRPRAGRPLLIGFWASWCLPCQAEVPVLGRIHESVTGADLVAISFEPDAEAARGFLARNRPAYPVALSNAEAISPLLEVAFGDGAVPLPAAVLLDAQGNVARIFSGPLSVAAVEEAVRGLAAP